MKADVLVIGAGPAGSSAALVLARRGLEVLLVDRHEFPRDKVCGDALLPDATAALDRLGLLERVLSQAMAIDTLTVQAPNGKQVDLHARFATLRRIVLDDVLRQASSAAGARFLAPFTALGPIGGSEVVRGARICRVGAREEVAVEAPLTILATGASVGALRAFGAGGGEAASAVAARAYFDVPPALGHTLGRLIIVYEKTICPAYGWLFPVPGGACNVGVGTVQTTGARGRQRSLFALWDAFLESFPPARELKRVSKQLGPPRGAAIRSSFRGTDPGRPGLLVAGEAAGLTYPLTGEGIGKAIASGILAAEICLEALRAGGRGAADTARRYAPEARAAFARRFEGYRTAQAWMSIPWVCNFICGRASPGSFARRQLEGLVTEATDPRSLFSLSGFLRALVS